MRYRATGNLHKDFHLATNTTIQYVLKKYGQEFLRELFQRTAQRVYRDIYESLQAGNYTPLVEHWTYYYEREHGRFEINKKDGEVVFHVLECPAVRHLQERNVQVTKEFYLQIVFMNEAWSENTPFVITVELLGVGEYRHIIRSRKHASK